VSGSNDHNNRAACNGADRSSQLYRMSAKYTSQLAHATGIFLRQRKPQIIPKFGLSMLPISNRNGLEIGMEYQTVILYSRTDFVTT
jgi:hypothetical protein